MPGATKARELVVKTAQQYLDRLAWVTVSRGSKLDDTSFATCTAAEATNEEFEHTDLVRPNSGHCGLRVGRV